MNNNIKTYALLAGIIALFVFIGGLVGGTTGMVLAFIFALVLNFGAYWYSADMVLKMYNAQEVGPHNAPDLYNMIGELSRTADIPMPRVYVINESQANAFATGRDPENAAVAFTVGIMELLDYNELRGVAAHELSHIVHRDILISTVSAVVAGSIAGLANFAMFFGVRDENGRPNFLAGILIAILAPIAASVIQMAISRSREYLADEGAAYLTREPLALANALYKIDNNTRTTTMPIADAHPTTAQMMIINPLSGQNQDNLFATHPSTVNRIERLNQIAHSFGQNNY